MLYLFCFIVAFVVSVFLTPIMRIIALRFKILDVPHTPIKTHKIPTPYLGGVAISAAFIISLTIIRLLADFPTGTLRSLRGIFIGGFVIFILGFIDDIKRTGLDFKFKFFVEAIAALIIIFYGIKIEFIQPQWFGILITIIWIVGITNSVNIIDIMDGLAAGCAIIAAIGFFLVGLPAEEEIYVNFASVALIGACLGFLPFNLTKKYKIFMGDVGSLFIGFVLAAISLGTDYTVKNDLGVFAPILILAIPIYDTLLVMYFRWKKGILPFIGTKDHFALRLESIGYSRKKILLLVYIAGVFFACASFLATVVSYYYALCIYIIALLIGILLAAQLGRIKVE